MTNPHDAATIPAMTPADSPFEGFSKSTISRNAYRTGHSMILERIIN